QGGDGLTTGALIEGNVVVNNGVGGGAAINLDGVHDSVIVNNLLVNNHASGIASYVIDGASGPKGNEFLHNTVDMASDARWALLFWHATGPCLARNNILYNRNPNRGGITYGRARDVAARDSDFNIMDRVT